MNCTEIISKYINDDMSYAIHVATTFINEVLNDDVNHDYLLNMYVAYTVLHYKYYSNDEVRHECRSIEKQIEEYCAIHHCYNVLDYDSLLQNVIRYLCDLFINIV